MKWNEAKWNDMKQNELNCTQTGAYPSYASFMCSTLGLAPGFTCKH